MKKTLGPSPIIVPMPAVLIGTYSENGTANAMTAAWAAACCHRPPCLGVAVRHNRLTFANLQRKKAFTVNVPRTSNAAAVDYLGMVSGEEEPAKLDKVSFATEAGTKADAPIIIGCPLNVECVLVERLALGSHSWFVGEVVEVHADEEVLDDNMTINIKALDPLVYATPAREYRSLGSAIGPAYNIGRQFRDG